MVMAVAASTNSTAKAAMSTDSGTCEDAVAPATAPPDATAPNTNPRVSSMFPALKAPTAAVSEVTPTTTSDPVVAWAGDWPSR